MSSTETTEKRVQAPKTVGPNLAALTTREQAAEAWTRQATDGRRKAERAARKLALELFGPVPVEFDEFIPEPFARRFGLTPAERVTFNVEGLEFGYAAADAKRREQLFLIDRCPHCETGIRLLSAVGSLADVGRLFATRDPGFPDAKCRACRTDERAERSTT